MGEEKMGSGSWCLEGHHIEEKKTASKDTRQLLLQDKLEDWQW